MRTPAMSNCPIDLNHFVRMLDTDPPRWDGKALLDPRFVAEYCRTPAFDKRVAHSFINFMQVHASEPFKEYVRSCLKWAQDNPGVWRPGWIDAVRQQIRLSKS